MNGHVGPWVKVGVPAGVLERWRHSSSSHLRPDPVRGRFEEPPTGGFMSAVRTAKRTRTRTMVRTTRRRRNVGRRGRRRMYRARTLMPLTCARWLTTAGYTSLNPAAGAIAAYALSLNSAFDPLGGMSATQQPLGFDQYAALYNRYSVVAWRISLEVVSTDNTNPCVVGFTPLPSSTGLTTYLHYKELPGTVQRMITPDVDKVYLGARGSVKRWLSPRGAKILSNDNFSALIGANPAKLLYGHIYAQAMDGSADPSSINVVVRLQQFVVFHEPVTPARSTQ